MNEITRAGYYRSGIHGFKSRGMRGDSDDAGLDSPVGRIRPKKAPNAFRTISEVADELHIPQHVLRFWESKFSQVKPLKRGGGRRYYRPDDILLLRRISDLLYIQGYTIKGVQRLLREGGGQLSDNIPPPTADEREEREAAALEGLLPSLELAPPLRSPGSPSSRLRPDMEEAERLRCVLGEMLEELEQLRRMLP
jgi:DNA-binding transcriptional MerR regulator